MTQNELIHQHIAHRINHRAAQKDINDRLNFIGTKRSPMMISIMVCAAAVIAMTIFEDHMGKQESRPLSEAMRASK